MLLPYYSHLENGVLYRDWNFNKYFNILFNIEVILNVVLKSFRKEYNVEIQILKSNKKLNDVNKNRDVPIFPLLFRQPPHDGWLMPIVH